MHYVLLYKEKNVQIEIQLKIYQQQNILNFIKWYFTPKQQQATKKMCRNQIPKNIYNFHQQIKSCQSVLTLEDQQMQLQKPANPPKLTKLMGLYYLQTNALYEQQAIKDIKLELEAMHGVRLQRASTEYQVIFICQHARVGVVNNNNLDQTNMKDQSDQQKKFKQNNSRTTLSRNIDFCKYHVKFRVQMRFNQVNFTRFNRYRLIDYNLTHFASCRNPQESIFLKSRHLLTQFTPVIQKIIKTNRLFRRSAKDLSTKTIIKILSRLQQIEPNFLEKDLHDVNYIRKIKKKLDNIVGQARRKNIQEFDKWQLTIFKDHYMGQNEDQQEQDNLSSVTNFDFLNKYQQIQLKSQSSLLKLQRTSQKDPKLQMKNNQRKLTLANTGIQKKLKFQQKNTRNRRVSFQVQNIPNLNIVKDSKIPGKNVQQKINPESQEKCYSQNGQKKKKQEKQNSQSNSQRNIDPNQVPAGYLYMRPQLNDDSPAMIDLSSLRNDFLFLRQLSSSVGSHQNDPFVIKKRSRTQRKTKKNEKKIQSQLDVCTKKSKTKEKTNSNISIQLHQALKPKQQSMKINLSTIGMMNRNKVVSKQVIKDGRSVVIKQLKKLGE